MFLEIPGETRNMIYKIYLENENESRDEQERPVKSSFSGMRGRPNSIMVSYVPTSTSPTHEQEQWKESRRKLLDSIYDAQLDQMTEIGTLTIGARNAFERYKLEHEIYMPRSLWINFSL
jgi:hypothetical protein